MNLLVWSIGFVVGMLVFGIYKQTAHFKRLSKYHHGDAIAVAIIMSLCWPLTLVVAAVVGAGWWLWTVLMLVVHMGTTLKVPQPIAKWLGIEYE